MRRNHDALGVPWRKAVCPMKWSEDTVCQVDVMYRNVSKWRPMRKKVHVLWRHVMTSSWGESKVTWPTLTTFHSATHQSDHTRAFFIAGRRTRSHTRLPQHRCSVVDGQLCNWHLKNDPNNFSSSPVRVPSARGYKPTNSASKLTPRALQCEQRTTTCVGQHV